MATTSDKYVLVKSFGRANIQNRLWYVMKENDLSDLAAEQSIAFGDRAYSITDQTLHIYGSNSSWYEAPVTIDGDGVAY